MSRVHANLSQLTVLVARAAPEEQVCDLNWVDLAVGDATALRMERLQRGAIHVLPIDEHSQAICHGWLAQHIWRETFPLDVTDSDNPASLPPARRQTTGKSVYIIQPNAAGCNGQLTVSDWDACVPYIDHLEFSSKNASVCTEASADISARRSSPECLFKDACKPEAAA